MQSYLPRTETEASRFRNGIYNELSGVPELNIEDPGKPMVRIEVCHPHPRFRLFFLDPKASNPLTLEFG